MQITGKCSTSFLRDVMNNLESAESCSWLLSKDLLIAIFIINSFISSLFIVTNAYISSLRYSFRVIKSFVQSLFLCIFSKCEVREKLFQTLGNVDHRRLETAKEEMSKYIDSAKGGQKIYSFCIASRSYVIDLTGQSTWLPLPSALRAQSVVYRHILNHAFIVTHFHDAGLRRVMISHYGIFMMLFLRNNGPMCLLMHHIQ